MSHGSSYFSLSFTLLFFSFFCLNVFSFFSFPLLRESFVLPIFSFFFILMSLDSSCLMPKVASLLNTQYKSTIYKAGRRKKEKVRRKAKQIRPRTAILVLALLLFGQHRQLFPLFFPFFSSLTFVTIDLSLSFLLFLSPSSERREQVTFLLDSLDSYLHCKNLWWSVLCHKCSKINAETCISPSKCKKEKRSLSMVRFLKCPILNYNKRTYNLMGKCVCVLLERIKEQDQGIENGKIY